MDNSFESLLRSISILLPSFVAVLTFRGYFRALAAKIAGDKTAKDEGFLTLNPAAHIDVLGILIFLVSAVIFGIIFPDSFSIHLLFLFLIIAGVRWSFEVPVNERNFRNENTGIALIAFAGPIGNFALSLIALYFYKYFPYYYFPDYATKSFVEVLASIINISTFFGVLNLIPLPPFDCGRLLPMLLPRSLKHLASTIEEYAVFIFLAILILGSSFFVTFVTVISLMIKKLLLNYLVF